MPYLRNVGLKCYTLPKMLNYIGNGHYCYANSASMLLESVGEHVASATIEVLSGTALGATYNKQEKSLWFNNQTLLPDLGITKALEILGFECKVHVSESLKDFPLEELKNDLTACPAVLGPVDQFHLTYNPYHKQLKGADHYVLAYQIEKDKCYLHDPAGYPHVFLSLKNLKKAWQGEGVIRYAKGHYRYITKSKRVEHPSKDKIYEKAMEHFREIYRVGERNTGSEMYFIGREAIIAFANNVKESNIPQGKITFLKNFLFQLGAKRANDFALFFAERNPKLANLKKEQSKLHGHCHTHAVQENWQELSECLKDLSETEKDFRNTLLS